MTRWMTHRSLALAVVAPLFVLLMYGDWECYENSAFCELSHGWLAVISSEGVVALMLLLILPPIARLKWKPIKGSRVRTKS